LAGLQLQSLHLTGFKTFASPTLIEFAEGITAVVGANGSGKSNLVDALRWALGEQSMRDLRGRRAEDVIFSGSQSRKPSAMAEVRLTFGNETGWFPIDSSEVELTRRLYRSSEGEYLLNGDRVRLRDVADVVREGGLAAGGHTVVGQGMVDGVLSLRGVERRGFIAAVAGVTPYEARRNEALQKLAQTRQNVAGAQIVYDEISPRLRLLRRQANLAQGALAARAELDSALRWHYHRQWTRLRIDQLEAESALGQREHTVRSLRTEIEALEEERKDVEEANEAFRQDRQARRDRVLAAEYGLQRAQDLHLAASQARNRAQGEQRQLRERLESPKQKTFDDDQLQRLESDLEALTNELSGRRHERGSRLAALDRRRQEAATHRARASALRIESQDLKTRYLAERDRLEQLQGDRSRTERAVVESGSSLPLLRTELEAAQAGHAESGRNVDLAEAELERAKGELESSGAGVATARAVRAHTVSRYEAATEAIPAVRAQREDLVRARPGDPSVVSVIASIQAPSHVGLALAAAIGSLMDAPAQPSDGEAGPRLAVEPTPTWRTAVADALTGAGFEVTGWLIDLVRLDDPGSPIRGLLAATLVLPADQDLEKAWSIVASLQGELVGTSPLRIVDLDGLIRQPGARDVAPVRARESVRRESTIGQLEDRLRELHSEVEFSRRERDNAEAALATAGKRLTEAETSFQMASVAALTAKARAENSGRSAQALEKRLVGEERALEQLLTGVRTLSGRIAESEAQVTELEREIAESQAEVSGAEESVQDAEIAARDEEAAIRDVEAEATLLERRMEMERQELARLVRARERELQDRRSASERLATVENEIAILDETLHASARSLESTRLELEAARAAALDAPIEPDANTGALLSARVSELHSRVESAVAEVERERARLTRIAEVSETVINDCSLDLDQHPSTLSVADVGREFTEIEIRRLRVRAEQADDVEPGVAEEYRELASRRDVLAEQINDLLMASEELESMLREADREVRRRFRMTFSHVNSLFAMFFEEIFGGGSGELVFETIEEVESVDIVAQLPGKRARDLAGLSGGERTLVAGAFLFALLSAAPPPFCVLDEVDAALDESNVDRYLSVLRDLAQQTQFVVVTHNRGTMAAANTLYGIVLDPGTGSRALSLRLDEAMAG
jgi:chromosome segregation protein